MRRSQPALALVLAAIVAHGCSTMPVAITSDAGPNTANIAPVEFSDRKVATPALLKPPAHVGLASWYGPGFTGKKTASGDIFDDRELTAAHRTLPLGSKAKVTNLSNGKSVYVEINDRGPFVEDRIIDLSQAAASALGMIDQGIVQVRIDLLTGEEGLEAGGVD